MLLSTLYLPGSAITLGIDDPTPLLAWKVTSTTAGDAPTAYEVQVGTTLGGSDVLATGKATSTAQSIELRAALTPATPYFWRVRVWDASNTATAWVAATFETGLIAHSDWKGARWIGAVMTGAPQLRKTMTLPTTAIASARLYVSAGGYADVQINGTQVSDALEPGFTKYDKRLQYVTHDVTAALVSGDNVLAVTLGRGFYGLTTVTAWNWSTAPWHSDPKLLALLVVKYTDGTTSTIISDSSWRASAGPTTADSAYLGEAYDARLETAGWQAAGFNDTAWSAATVMTAPKGAPIAQAQPPIRKLTPITGTFTRWGTSGSQNLNHFTAPAMMVGGVRITMTGMTAGTVVTIAYGERMNGSALYNNNNLITGIPQTDTYISKGGTETWEPRFSYKGFHDVLIGAVGLFAADAADSTITLTNVVGIPIRTDLSSTGSFASSSALLNQLNSMFRTSLAINTHGIVTDTPVYERNGWLGDSNITGQSAILSYNMGALFKKWLNDMADTLSEGAIMPIMVPHSGNFAGAGPEWTSAFVLIAWKVYLTTGDTTVLVQNYEKMKAYTNQWLANNTTNQWSSDYGDWSSPAGNNAVGTGYDMTATTYVMKQTDAMAKIATLLGYTADAAAWSVRVSTIQAALHGRLFVAASNTYLPDVSWAGAFRSGNSALALANGIVPTGSVAAVAAAMESDIRATQSYHVNGGIVSNEVLLPQLAVNGYIDTALQVLLQTTFPSWGQWATASPAATSDWNSFGTVGAQRSFTHHMHGAYVAFLYQYLAGIIQTGPSTVTIAPYLPTSAVTSVDASVETARGPVTVHWDITGGVKTLTFTTPPGLTATYAGATVASGSHTYTL